MFIFEKNGLLFVSGGYFLSTLSEAKMIPPKDRIKIINKLLVNTTSNLTEGQYDMLAISNKFRKTWHYIRSLELKQVIFKSEFDKKTIAKGYASLSTYILECLSSIRFSDGSMLNDRLSNALVCFKISDDLFGYILFKHGTIHPGDGDIVSTRENIKDSIINLIRKHNRSGNIETKINTIVVTEELEELRDNLLNTGVEFLPLGYDSTKEQYVLNSEELFWSKNQLKKFNKSKFINVVQTRQRSIKIGLASAGVACLLVVGLLYYQTNKPDEIQVVTTPQKSNLINASSMISQCFKNSAEIFGQNFRSSKYFWKIDKVSCDISGLKVHFMTTDTVPAVSLGVDDITSLYHNPSYQIKSDTGLGNSVILTQNLNLDNNFTSNSSKMKQIESLDTMSNSLGISYQADELKKQYVITSNISPIYMNANHYLDGLALKSINGVADSNGGYNWQINGGF